MNIRRDSFRVGLRQPVSTSRRRCLPSGRNRPRGRARRALAPRFAQATHMTPRSRGGRRPRSLPRVSSQKPFATFTTCRPAASRSTTDDRAAHEKNGTSSGTWGDGACTGCRWRRRPGPTYSGATNLRVLTDEGRPTARMPLPTRRARKVEHRHGHRGPGYDYQMHVAGRQGDAVTVALQDSEAHVQTGRRPIEEERACRRRWRDFGQAELRW
jgi:hypothetical protein